ncbi:MAG: lecithin retinol acyltransferase family protein [Paraclostridium sp.]
MKEENRKRVEDISNKIHPTIGKTVRTVNNLNDTIENLTDSLENGILRGLFASEVKELELADHLFVQRIGYTHHGMYIGNGQFIHYLRECIRIDTLEFFADGAKIQKKELCESGLAYSKDEAILRGHSRIYEDNYNLFKNNCENFVRWSRNGGEVY